MRLSLFPKVNLKTNIVSKSLFDAAAICHQCPHFLGKAYQDLSGTENKFSICPLGYTLYSTQNNEIIYGVKVSNSIDKKKLKNNPADNILKYNQEDFIAAIGKFSKYILPINKQVEEAEELTSVTEHVMHEIRKLNAKADSIPKRNTG